MSTDLDQYLFYSTKMYVCWVRSLLIFFLHKPCTSFFFFSVVLMPDSFSLNAKMQTKRSMESGVPYAVLGILYAYLLYLSWTPETVELIFASKYLLPEVCINSSIKLSSPFQRKLVIFHSESVTSFILGAAH